MHKIILSMLSLCVFFTAQCSTENNTAKGRLYDADNITRNTDITTNVLKVIKHEGGNIEQIKYAKAITENAGTEKETKCLCQAVAFRVAQLASQAWSDGVFRSADIIQIRTGWNTDGPYEFFSDNEYNGEKGDLAIPAKKILIQKKDGSTPTPKKNLSVKDCWYEITLKNGVKLSFNTKKGENGIYTANFLKLRKKFIEGDTSLRQAVFSEKGKIQATIAKTPFSRLSMQLEQ